MKNKPLVMVSALALSFLSSCGFKTRQNITILHGIEYSDRAVDKEAFDDYFSDNDDYPSYSALKENVSDLLDNVKSLKVDDAFEESLHLMRFSAGPNGLLQGETFLSHHDTFFRLGGAWGGYGVTQFVIQTGDDGDWLYYLYSYGSGIHQTDIGVFNLITDKFYQIEGLDLEINKDYAFVLDESDNSIDIYEASIFPFVLEGNFDFQSYHVKTKTLIIEDIGKMEKKAIE